MAQKTGMATAPFPLVRRSDARLVTWFRSASRPRVAYSVLGVAAFGYSLVALLLSVAKALIAAWLLGSSAMYLVAWANGASNAERCPQR